MKALLLTILIFSCSNNQRKFNSQDYQAFDKQDYIDHLSSYVKPYMSGVKMIRLSGASKRYLKKLYKKILSNNELLFNEDLNAKFFIVKSDQSFHFSLPKGNLFFSSALVKKFLDTEDLLLSALTFEMIKSNRNIYPKKVIVPTGHIETSRILELTRIPFEAKTEIDKWAFISLKRAGHDPYAYLLWLQIQNKNALEFGLLLRGRKISREEYSLKNFLVKEGNEGNNIEEGERNSSPGYYRLIEEIKEKDS